MNTAEQIILVVLAAVLAIFLILAIVAVAYVIKLVKTLRDIAERADRVIGSAESVAELFKRASGPMTVLHFVRGIADAVMSHKESHRK
jgi:hypothetical protein